MEKGPRLFQIPVGLCRRTADQHLRTIRQVPAETRSRVQMSKELAQRGFKFSGRPSSTPSCRPPAWSTTIWSPVTATRRCAEASESRPGLMPCNVQARPHGRRQVARMAAHAVGAAARPSRSFALDIEVEDIAHGLARVGRWNGQTSGAHIYLGRAALLLVETMARSRRPQLTPQRPAFRLLHDAPEYVIGDMISPSRL